MYSRDPKEANMLQTALGPEQNPREYLKIVQTMT